MYYLPKNHKYFDGKIKIKKAYFKSANVISWYCISTYNLQISEKSIDANFSEILKGKQFLIS